MPGVRGDWRQAAQKGAMAPVRTPRDRELSAKGEPCWEKLTTGFAPSKNLKKRQADKTPGTQSPGPSSSWWLETRNFYPTGLGL